MTRPTGDEIERAAENEADNCWHRMEAQWDFSKEDFAKGARWALNSDYVKGLEAKVKDLDEWWRAQIAITADREEAIRELKEGKNALEASHLEAALVSQKTNTMLLERVNWLEKIIADSVALQISAKHLEPMVKDAPKAFKESGLDYGYSAFLRGYQSGVDSQIAAEVAPECRYSKCQLTTDECQSLPVLEWKRPEEDEADMPEMWGPMIVQYLDDYGAKDAYFTVVFDGDERVNWRQRGGKLVAYATLPLPSWLEEGK